MLILLLIRCDWCWVLDTDSKPSERLLPRDDPSYGDVRKETRGERLATTWLDAVGISPYAGAVGAPNPKHGSNSTIPGLKNEDPIAAEESGNDQLNALE